MNEKIGGKGFLDLKVLKEVIDDYIQSNPNWDEATYKIYYESRPDFKLDVVLDISADVDGNHRTKYR